MTSSSLPWPPPAPPGPASEPTTRRCRRRLPQGPQPAPIAAGACALDAAVHAWDIAAALGRPGFLPAELAARLLPAARAVVEPLRAYGAYAAALSPRPAEAGDDDAAAELLRYLGRDPQWSAAPGRSAVSSSSR